MRLGGSPLPKSVIASTHGSQLPWPQRHSTWSLLLERGGNPCKGECLPPTVIWASVSSHPLFSIQSLNKRSTPFLHSCRVFRKETRTLQAAAKPADGLSWLQPDLRCFQSEVHFPMTGYQTEAQLHLCSLAFCKATAAEMPSKTLL